MGYVVLFEPCPATARAINASLRRAKRAWLSFL